MFYSQWGERWGSNPRNARATIWCVNQLHHVRHVLYYSIIRLVLFSMYNGIMLEIKGVRFEVEIVHKRIKNLYLRMHGNRITASAPLLMPDYLVYRFIDKKRDWIYRTYEYMSYKETVSSKYHGGDVFYIFDEAYHLERIIGKKGVSIKDRTIYLSYKDDSEDGIKYLYKYLDRYLMEKAKEYLDQHLPFLQDYGYHEIPELKCRLMSSKWGVCYTRKNSICVSSYLIHYPLYCLEYIMIHEMTHFIVPNHSKRFYEIVGKNMPSYKEAVKRLK